MQNSPHKQACAGMAKPHIVSLHDIGDFPSSIIASQIAEDPRDFCALRLCCKSAYGAELSTHSSIRDRDATDHISSHISSSPSSNQPRKSTSHPAASSSSTSQHHSICHTGLSRQTTRLHLYSRVFLAPTALAKYPTNLCRATQLLCRHPAVTNLSISQPPTVKNSKEILLQAVPDALPLLSRLSILLAVSESWSQDGMRVITYTEVATACLARLHCLTHLTLRVCSLGSDFSKVLAHLNHLTVLNLDRSIGVSDLVVSGLAAVRSISVAQTDVAKLVLSDCGALHELNAASSRSLISCCISSCFRLSTLKLCRCPALLCLDVQSCVELEHLDISDCDVLTELLAGGCSKLTKLSASPCEQLTHLDITGCSALHEVSMSGLAPEQLDSSVHVLVKKMTIKRSEMSSLPALLAIKDLILIECIQLEVLDLFFHHQLCIVDLYMCDALLSLRLPSCVQKLSIAHCSFLLAPDTSSLPQLKSLNLQNCDGILQLNIFCLEHLMSLEVVKCHSMRTLLVSNCPIISSIKVISSCLAELCVTQLPLLANLNLSSPWSRSIEGDVAALRVTLVDCPALHSLAAQHTGLAALDVSSLTSLRSLDVTGGTSLMELNAAGCACLENLALTGCSRMQHLDLHGITKLRSLRLAGCSRLVDTNPHLLDGCIVDDLHLSFTTMPSLSALAGLTHLNMEGCNEVTTMDFACCPEIQSLTVTNCPLLQQLDIARLEHLQNLFIEDCKSLSQVGGTWPEGITRTLSTVYARNLPKSLISQIKLLSLINCPVQSLDLAFFPCLEELCVYNCHELLVLDTRDCSGLHTLKIAACQALSSVSISGAMFLLTLDLQGLRRLQHLRFDGCSALQHVSIQDSALVELDFQGSHQISSVSLSNLPDLERVVAVDLRALKSLRIHRSSKLSTLLIVGSTESLKSVYIDHESPLGTLDLTQAPLLRGSHLPADPYATCAVCLEGSITHAFLHLGFTHCICSRCFQKFDTPSDTVGNVKKCPVCSERCQLAQLL